MRIDFRAILFPALALLTLAVYAWSIQPQNAYVGVVPVRLDASSTLLALAWIALAITVMPTQVRRPSDLFLLFYVVACFFWGSVLWAATGLLSLPLGALMLVLLYLPALTVKLFQRYLSGPVSEFVAPVYVFKRSQLVLLLAATLAVGAALAMASFGPGDFGLNNVYERRLAGREALTGSAIAGYAINMTINGVAPLLAFMAGYRRSPLVFALAAGYATLLFWQIGLKSPFINVGALAAVGFALSLPSMRRNLGLLALLALVGVFGYVVWEVFDGGYSAISDYLLRRIAMVQPQVQSYYVDFWHALPLADQMFGTGLGKYLDWSFMIGDTYLHNPETNANTNGFLHALLKGGLVGYLVALVVVGAFISVLDAMYERSGMMEFVGLAGLYGILVSEQGYTTVFVTSGIILCFVLIMLCSYPNRSAARSAA